MVYKFFKKQNIFLFGIYFRWKKTNVLEISFLPHAQNEYYLYLVFQKVVVIKYKVKKYIR